MREIPAAAVKPENRMRVGDALAAIGRKNGLTDGKRPAEAVQPW